MDVTMYVVWGVMCVREREREREREGGREKVRDYVLCEDVRMGKSESETLVGKREEVRDRDVVGVSTIR